MDLQLQHQSADFAEPVLDSTITQESTQEAIVPDSEPDIVRIADCCAQAFLTGKQIRDGSVTVSGQIRAEVLYLPEGDGGLTSLELSIPFTCMAECTGLSERGSAMALPRVRSAQARLLNPRKLLLRVDLSVDVKAYEPQRITFASAAAEDCPKGTQQLVVQEKAAFLVAALEKPFSFTDSLDLGLGEDEPLKLLSMRVQPLPGEAKLIGSKLLLKGSAEAELLLNMNGSLRSVRQTLSFSQIMEVPEAGENNTCEVRYAVTGMSLEAGRGGAELTLELLAQAEILENRTISLLCDIYSTSHELSAAQEEFRFHTMVEQAVRTVPLRALVECPVMVRSVVHCWADLDTVSAEMEGGQTVLLAKVQVSLLYLDDGDELQSVHKSFDLSCRVDNAAHDPCHFWCTPPREVFAAPAAGGAEVRLQLDFHFLLEQDNTRSVISTASIGQERSGQAGERPSVILRMAAPGERLWDLAKFYGTTVDEIIRANHLEEGGSFEGTMLLIPRAR